MSLIGGAQKWRCADGHEFLFVPAPGRPLPSKCPVMLTGTKPCAAGVEQKRRRIGVR